MFFQIAQPPVMAIGSARFAGLNTMRGLMGTEGVHDTLNEVIRGTQILLRTQVLADDFSPVISLAALSRAAQAMESRGYTTSNLHGVGTGTLSFVVRVVFDKPDLETVVQDFHDAVNDGFRSIGAYSSEDIHVEIKFRPPDEGSGNSTGDGANAGDKAGNTTGRGAGGTQEQETGALATIRAAALAPLTFPVDAILKLTAIARDGGETVYKVHAAAAQKLVDSLQSAGASIKELVPSKGFFDSLEANLRDLAMALSIGVAVSGTVLLGIAGIVTYAILKNSKNSGQ